MSFNVPTNFASRPVAVIGAGTLGRRIALMFAAHGARVGIYDLAEEQRRAAVDFVSHNLPALTDHLTGVEPGQVSAETDLAEAVHDAWRLHFDDVRHSLVGGFYQGWDLHPAQLVTRYAALYAFFLAGIEPAGARLRNFVDKAAQATRVGNVFDDAATGQGLLNFFLRGINSGAVTEAEALRMTGLTEEEALAMTGLTADEFRGRSFVKIRRGRT